MFLALKFDHACLRGFKLLTRRCQRLRAQAARALTASCSASSFVLGASCGTSALLAGVAAAPSPPDEPSNKSVRTPVGGSKPSTGIEFGDKRRRATDTLLIFNCACLMLQWLSKGVLTFWGAKVNSYILEGQWWRLFTPSFLHSGLLHLAINSYALHSLGPQVESLSGTPRFLSIYLVSAVAGTVTSFVMTPQPSLGASGAIFGLGAALGLFYWRHRDVLGKVSDQMLQQLTITAAINIVYSLLVKNIDNWGHIGGMLGGASVAWLLGPHLKIQHDVATTIGTPRNASSRGVAQFVDQPPVPWLAYPEGYVFRERGVSDRRSVDSVTGTQQKSSSVKVSSHVSSSPDDDKVKSANLRSQATKSESSDGIK
ncbi:hypothetical protein CEUSTIGMA_g3405.t1 [Chlamydomonas eustigma]|uniref:Peptidase S54 rhomboid domain-containing protein n=1 Tax=Chlamydomonas eustigma TaxID=1157962 RepID=A0A250WZB9_9CHLO|nr:hypothetical protein CEUSTIGMA_g3405.t1 [Chlamydomonas eustigma]|eukprot:GAX75962.1 hypothetical protein CEUSTIGMA_g3405.t1 [Chlamydomonas eustigma]